MLWEAVPNFSTGADGVLVAELGAGRGVLDVHADADHGRCVVTLVDSRMDRLVAALFRRVALAVERIDLRKHVGVHPRIGAADVVPLVPLDGTPMAGAVEAAHRLGDRVWRELRVPVYWYGGAGDGRRLADVRAGRVRPDLGDVPHATAGAVCIGARAPLVAYNVAFPRLPLAAGRRVAAEMRALPGVQALAFALPGGRTQVSMNLTRLDEAGVPAVHRRVRELAAMEGEPELVGLCPAAAAGPGCDGGILEARMAGLAAVEAAGAALARSGEELTLLAGRLRAEGEALGGLGAGQDAVLGGAERAAALVRLLRAARLATAGREALLLAAARGLRVAVAPATAARHPRRVELLDHWLAARDL